MIKNKFLVLYNPVSCNGKALKILKKLEIDFNKMNFEYESIQTNYPGHMTDLCATNKFEKIIIIGGDGTLNEALNGIMINPINKQQKFGFLPGGTGNSFLHDLGGENYYNAINIIARGKTKKIDVLKLDFMSKVKYSLNIVGWGLVSDINILSEKMRFLGSARYNVASLYYIFNKKSRVAKIKINDQVRKDDFLFVLCMNTIHTGKGMKAAPHARLDDGLLDLIIVKYKIPTLSLISLLLKIFKGSHITSKYVEYKQVKKVELHPINNDILNIDGENKWNTPVRISVMPQELCIYAL